MKYPKYKKQDGAVAIIVSITIMAILSLIVISFSQLMRREERQSLDRHLSSQAYYAAESAINDAAAALSRGDINANHNTCKRLLGSGPLDSPVLDSALDVEYSCVTLSSDPTSLEFDSVPTNQSVQTELHSRDSAGNPSYLDNIDVTWQNPSGPNEFANDAVTEALPQNWDVNQVGLLRFEIFRLVDATGTYNRNALLNDRRIYWFYPNAGGTETADWTTTTNGSIINGSCSGNSCTVKLDGLPAGSFVVRMRSHYAATKVSIKGNLTAAGGTAYFYGAQVVVDATGKANDVLRRISARIAINETYPIPEYAVQAFDGICKDIDVVTAPLPGSVTYDPECQ